MHGGGFYRVEKFRLVPGRLPEPLHWFKWEAYTTWLSGFALFIVVYYSHATSFLIDPSVADLTAWEAIALSVGGIVLAWFVYDGHLPRLRARRSAARRSSSSRSSAPRPGPRGISSRHGPPTCRSAR